MNTPTHIPPTAHSSSLYPVYTKRIGMPQLPKTHFWTNLLLTHPSRLRRGSVRLPARLPLRSRRRLGVSGAARGDLCRRCASACRWAARQCAAGRQTLPGGACTGARRRPRRRAASTQCRRRRRPEVVGDPGEAGGPGQPPHFPRYLPRKARQPPVRLRFGALGPLGRPPVLLVGTAAVTADAGLAAVGAGRANLVSVTAHLAPAADGARCLGCRCQQYSSDDKGDSVSHAAWALVTRGSVSRLRLFGLTGQSQQHPGQHTHGMDGVTVKG